MSVSSLLFRFLPFSVGLLLLHLAANTLLHFPFYPLLYFLHIFLLLVHCVSMFILLQALQKKAAVFVRTFMGVFGIKMLLSLSFLLLPGLLYKDLLKPIAVHFLLVYFAYFVFFIVWLLQTIKKHSLSSK